MKLINTLKLKRNVVSLPDLRWSLLQVRGHLDAAFIQEPELPEQQGELPQVFLKLPEAILVHGLALGHTVRKLNQRHTASRIISGVLNIFRLMCKDRKFTQFNRPGQAGRGELHTDKTQLDRQREMEG